MEIRKTRPVSLFLSTPSARRATEEYMRIRMGQFISIHALREEGDSECRPRCRFSKISIHALREEGDLRRSSSRPVPCNFYPRPPRGGRPAAVRAAGPPREISIHALREEGDQSPSSVAQWMTYFYPRPPRGGRPVHSDHQPPAGQFLSTPSARRATASRSSSTRTSTFLSTPSARRATGTDGRIGMYVEISIHALREEGDNAAHITPSGGLNFYPRPPRGGRPVCFDDVAILQDISIHALREEGDLRPCSYCPPFRYFYPRPPRGGRRNAIDAGRIRASISIHALREEGDGLCMVVDDEGRLFLSTPSARRATMDTLARTVPSANFYPRPPRGGRLSIRPATHPP